MIEGICVTKSYNLEDFKCWLKWHLEIIKFDKITVIDNESLVDIESICKENKRINYIKKPGNITHYDLLNEYVNNSDCEWVMPIDDDEFIYVSDKYDNNINTYLTDFKNNHNDNKIIIGWLNLFPITYKETRIENCIQNAICYNQKLWENLTGFDTNRQTSDLYVKCIVNRCKEWNYLKYCKCTKSLRHNPQSKDKEIGFVVNNCSMDKNLNKMQIPTNESNDIIVIHYQYKSNSEWLYKRTKRPRIGQLWNTGKLMYKKQDYILNSYKEIYDLHYEFKYFLKVIDLWNKHL